MKTTWQASILRYQFSACPPAGSRAGEGREASSSQTQSPRGPRQLPGSGMTIPSPSCLAVGEEPRAVPGLFKTPTPLKQKYSNSLSSCHLPSAGLAFSKSQSPDDKLLQGMINILFIRLAFGELSLPSKEMVLKELVGDASQWINK